jgi:orotidine-5'-phosphate decarboxylase
MRATRASERTRIDLARSRLIVGLDVSTQKEAEQLVDALIGEVGLFKVGKQLFMRAGPGIVESIRKRGGEVFLDLKFHDIPRTVARASMEATRLGVRMFNVHASGSLEMMELTVREVRKVCRLEGLRRPILLAVTVLTSLSRDDLARVGVRSGVKNQVVRLARLAKEAGMDGVVASPQEVRHIRAECGRRHVIVTPGVRPAGESWDDQKRVMTPEEAIRAGSDYLVVVRPILNARDPVAAARGIVADIDRALSASSTRSRRLPRTGSDR